MSGKASDIIAIGGVVDPDANAAGALNSAYLDMRNFQKAMAIVMAGDLGTSATLDFKIVQATDSGGTGKKDISGLAITQLTQAGTDSNKQAIINISEDDLDVANGFRYIALEMTTATATSDSSALLLGVFPTYGPASDWDISTVDEIVG